MLHLNAKQTNEIYQHYNTSTSFHKLFSDDIDSQQTTLHLFQDQGMDLHKLDDLGNGWSKRWSTHGGTGNKHYTHILL